MQDITGYPHYQLKLQLRNHVPCYQKQYKLTPDDAREVERQLNDLAESGIIEPSQSVEWNVPLFLVDKKDGKKRLIADLRKTNLAVEPRVVALPPIQQLLDEIQLQRPAFWSSYDLFSGYFQILLSEESRDVTSVTGPVSGLRWRWTRCPFGLNVSPSAMLAVLNQVLGRLRESRQLGCYMDDVISLSLIHI